MDFRYFWFLSIGLTRVYQPRDGEGSTSTTDKLCEPQASSVCRRNILMLSGALAVAGLAGVESWWTSRRGTGARRRFLQPAGVRPGRLARPEAVPIRPRLDAHWSSNSPFAGARA